MSKPANKALIGAFVIGALALAVIAVVVFGSGRIFKEKIISVMYFEGSIKGLSIGSPVMFRGVRIGSVTNIQLQYRPQDISFIIPVYIEIDLDKIKVMGEKSQERQIDEFIAKGLRAELELQSVVTGQLMINLDFYPGKPAKLLKLDKRYEEIPTIPSDLDEFMKTASKIPLKELIDKLMGSLAGIEKAVNSPKITASMDALSQGLGQARSILTKIDGEIAPILVNMKDSSHSLKELMRKSQGVPQEMDKALANAQTTLKQAEKTLVTVQEIASENSALMLDVDTTLQEVSKTARSVRFLTDYLQRYPESLIKGKQKGD